MNKKIYIEAGANDGIFQSRSVNLENNPEYLGILIEPVPIIFNQCVINRPNSLHYNCALVDFNFSQPTIDLHLHHLHYAMATLVKSDHEKYNNSITVPARTLESILEENKITDIDYFFLDVEGFELNVLNGIDFGKRSFKYIEVECHYPLLNISKEKEISQHQEFFQKYNYIISNTINDEGHLKLIFTPS